MDAFTLPPSHQQAADLRTLQIVWSAVIGGVVLATGVMGGFVLTGSGRMMAEHAATLFYLDAGLNMVAIVAAFAVQRRLMDRLPTLASYDEVVAAIRTSGVLSLALLELSALAACVVAFLTGELVNLLFVVPFFGFALVFFPTTPRFEALLELARRG